MNLVGITIGCGEKFSRMAEFAAREWTRCTGRPGIVLDHIEQTRRGLSEPHRLKFDLFRLVDHRVDAVAFFDADMVFLEEFDPVALTGPDGFAAVRDLHDQTWIIDDAARARVRPQDYFNSGFFLIHRDRAEILDLAATLTGYLRTPFKDQTHLNAAANLLRVRTCYLPARFNTHVDPRHTATLDGVVGAHLHWIRHEPIDQLARYYTDAREMFWRS